MNKPLPWEDCEDPPWQRALLRRVGHKLFKETPMGCDIHWFSETKQDGTWICDQAASLTKESFTYSDGTVDEYPVMDNFPGRDRDYWFFGLLTGTRTDWPWSFEAKGMPEGVSVAIAEMCDHDGEDGHTHSFLSRAELKAKLAELPLIAAQHLINPPVRKNEQEAVVYHMQRLTEVIGNLNAPVPDEDQRIVFWYDN